MDCFALTNAVFAASAREVPCREKKTKIKEKTKLLQSCLHESVCRATRCNRFIVSSGS